MILREWVWLVMGEFVSLGPGVEARMAESKKRMTREVMNRSLDIIATLNLLMDEVFQAEIILF